VSLRGDVPLVRTPTSQPPPHSAPRRCVLVVDDDDALRRALCERLRDETIEPCEAPDPEAVESNLDFRDADLMLLGLRGYDALETLRRVRAKSRTHVLALLDSAVDGVDAIEAGADDFVRMPCSAREIVARTRGALRRQSWRAGEPDQLAFGGLVIDRNAHEVRVGGALVPMPLREYELLVYLASSPNKVHGRTELLAQVWHASPEWLGVATVTEHVRRLRGRLAKVSGGPTWIRTVRNVGYRFDPSQRASDPRSRRDATGVGAVHSSR
jgi:DNA-binding response OmpR family regulator